MGSSKLNNQYIYSIQSVWIVPAWQSIYPWVTVKDFKCCTSDAVEGTDVMLWIGKDDEITEYEDGDSDSNW